VPVVISTLLVLVSLAYVAFLAVVELWVAARNEPTLSLRLQLWVHANYQVAGVLIFLAGFLLAHFTEQP
jgi:hypothetical protein